MVKEKWAFVLTAIAGVCYCRAHLMPKSFSLAFDRSRTAPLRASAWWWYCGRTEGASALA